MKHPISIALLVGALFAVLLSSNPTQAQVGVATDVVFLIDGSGSIDSNDWEIQKAGIALAIQDPDRFESDAAITVVQWSSTSRVELDRWILSSPDQRDAAAEQIRNLDQLGGGTSPHLGINTALNAFSGSLDPALNQVLCLSTDGRPSSSSALSSSASNAEAAGFERLSVVAIEDPPFFEAADAETFYGPVVFGGGGVTVARSAVEFANLIGAACLNPPLDLVALEANQAIQTWNNDIALIEGKETVVRAFVEASDGSSVTTPGQLFGSRNGVALPDSPLAAANRNAQIEAEGDVVARRAERDASLNFELPDEWRSGTIDLRLELPGGVECADALPNNSCELQVSFGDAPDVTIRAVPITYPDAGGVDQTPSDFVLRQQVLRIDSLYPVDEAMYDRGPEQTFATQPTVFQITDLLTRERSAECALGPCDEAALWYGVALGDAPAIVGSDGRTRTTFGVADGIPSNTSSGYTHDNSQVANATGYFRNLAGHEVGHSAGLHHAVTQQRSERFGFLWLRTRRWTEGLCNEIGGGDAPLFPDLNDIDLLNGGGTVQRPTLGPIGDEATEVWGFDSRYLRGVNDNLAVIDPAVTMPLMSYCRNDTAGQGKWISEFGYENLRQSLGGGAGGGGGGGGGSWDALFVNGLIDLVDESTNFGAAETLPSGRVDFTSEGPFTLAVEGRDGGLLDAVSFEPALMEVESNPGDPENFVARFNVPVRVPEQPIGQIVLSYDGTTVGTLVASENAPTVEVDYPTGGVVLDSVDVTLRWTGQDADGDELSYSVYYSADGMSWRALAKGLSESSLTVARSQLAGSATGQIVVTASDGVNGAHALSEFFVVTNNGPEVAIVSPGEGSAFAGVQSVLLEAAAADREDGALGGGSVAWTSDLDGPLGTGTSLAVNASDLAEGEHVITVMVMDSDGQTATASVTITIERIATESATLRQRLERFADDLATAGDPTSLAAEQQLRSVLADQYWESGMVLTGRSGEVVFKAMREAAKLLEKDSTTADGCCDELVEIARTLTNEAVDAAVDLRPQRADQAARQAEAAERYSERSNAQLAINEFRKAWKVAN